MHNQLEKYLSQIEKQLAALPAEQRQEELREICSHLEMMIEGNVARGCDADEAIAKAIEQFGAARKIGKDLIGARINNRFMRKRIALAILASLAVSSIGTLPSFLMVSAVSSPGNIVSEHIRISMWIINIWSLALGIGCGWLTEVIAPKKTTITLTLIVFFDLILIMFHQSVVSAIILHPTYYSLQILKITAIDLLTLSAGAWSRRWQVEHRQRQLKKIAE